MATRDDSAEDGPQLNRQWVLARAPRGRLRVEDFELRDGELPAAGRGEVLCRVLWISIDAAGRAWMQGRTYRGEVGPGDVMPGFAIGQVVRSDLDELPSGSLVSGDLGWQEYAVRAAAGLTRVEPRERLSEYLSVIGITGYTAYFGLFEVGAAEAGETVVVSAAAGATGGLVGQLAKRHGCRVVGICGSPRKQAWLTDELGFDAALSHRSERLGEELRRACPDGVDVYFDNTGGRPLEATLGAMNEGGRIVCCGVVSQYDTSGPAAGPAGVPGLLITRRLTMRGFICTDFAARFAAAREYLEAGLGDGTLRVTEEVLGGLERAPQGLVGLLAGDNVGKRIVEVAAASRGGVGNDA